jgi:hypothetical protein
MIVIATDLDRVEANIAVFAGFEEGTERPVLFAVDQRPARDILVLMVRSSSDGDSAWTEPVRCQIEPWQVLG